MIGPLTASTSLTLECVGPAGNDQQTLAVTVDGPGTSPAAASETMKVGGGVLDLLTLAYFMLVGIVLRRRAALRVEHG